MTPSARIADAIALLERIEETIAGRGPSAETLIQRFFKQRRYAGSRDRKAITDLVYAIVRNRAALKWCIEWAQMPLSARSLMIAHLPSDEIDVLFDGSERGPAPLSAEERRLVSALPEGEMPDAVAAGVTPWLYDMLHDRFGLETISECAALNTRAPTDIRVNRLKAEPSDVLAGLKAQGYDPQPVEGLPDALRLWDVKNLDSLPAYEDGLFEIQDAAAQLAVAVSGVGPRQQVTDLCAGAGGKTLAAAAYMEHTGQVYAFDTDVKRLEALKARAKRAGVRTLQIERFPSFGDKRAHILASRRGKADIVLVDAPCSGSGTWRRQPELKWKLEPEWLSELLETQARLLDEAAALLKPGGRIVYMTCSLLPAENEEQAAGFLKRHGDFKAIAVPPVPGMAPGWALDGTSLCVSPKRHGMDGFFVALLEKGKPEKE